VRLLYATPAHQFPLGVATSLGRRLELLRHAGAAGTLILEDDYDSEFRYSGRPIPALQGLDRDGRVLFAGSFSKVLFPSLRLGYLDVPEDLVDRFSALPSITDRHAPLIEQAILTDFIAAGHFGRHLRRMRQAYSERLTVLVESAEERLGPWLEVPRVDAGLQIAGWLAHGLVGADVAAAARERAVEVLELSRYARRPLAREGLLLGFAAVGPRELRRGVDELAKVLASAVSPAARNGPPKPADAGPTATPQASTARRRRDAPTRGATP
jgi:GntR family transcriptional regulator/MocR family aminotransferase